ncbi:MAG: hypothetical protein LBT59_08925 [Clostridiales bacterium]|jgi:beta-mannosidase|nr:hypothetical protein [Clostridiales bacterium]
MKLIDLSGEWQLLEVGGVELPGMLPGCNYVDLIRQGLLEDPFWGENEKKAGSVAEKDWQYSRGFELEKVDLANENVDLVMDGVDTFATVTINGVIATETNNAYRSWRIPIKSVLKEGENSIQIMFRSPLPCMRNKQAKAPLTGNGVGYIRKPAYHFGWDWGPTLPPVGITGHIGIECFNERIDEVRVSQKHETGAVKVKIEARITGSGAGKARCAMTSPDGLIVNKEAEIAMGSVAMEFSLANPRLWWSNGLGAQPLYCLRLELLDSDACVCDAWDKKIGIRTIELDTSADSWGNAFRFLVNGVPIFAKGANWIPPDSFISRVSSRDLEFYLQSAANANMNMIRVWGGGYYESDDFYDLCDKYGLLVWQDFAFACVSYPFHEKEFLSNVRQEVESNVRRLRHRASLALWCGNNELQMYAFLRRTSKELKVAENRFFYETLPAWISELDGSRPYWPGSPNSGNAQDPGNLWSKGDTHLWQVWHGLFPIESFADMPTRFCSEFGMESLPSLKAIKSFTDCERLTLTSPELKAHQKAILGNEKMLYYILAKFRNPEKFEDYIYLSQITQAETVRVAVEQWRQRTGQCNGSLYWQLNDCWPVCSWSSIDYKKESKALQYKARHFYEMAMVSINIGKKDCSIFVTNDYPTELLGTLEWQLRSFSGECLYASSKDVRILPTSAQREASFDWKKASGADLRAVYLVAKLSQNGLVISESVQLMVPDRDAALTKPDIKSKVALSKGAATITLQSDTFARHVFVEVDNAQGPLSDNYFDMEPGREYILTCQVTGGSIPRISVHSLADVTPSGTAKDDARMRAEIRRMKPHPLHRFAYRFLVK